MAFINIAKKDISFTYYVTGHKQKVNILRALDLYSFSVFWTTTWGRGSAWRRLQSMVLKMLGAV